MRWICCHATRLTGTSESRCRAVGGGLDPGKYRILDARVEAWAQVLSRALATVEEMPAVAVVLDVQPLPRSSTRVSSPPWVDATRAGMILAEEAPRRIDVLTRQHENAVVLTNWLPSPLPRALNPAMC